MCHAFPVHLTHLTISSSLWNHDLCGSCRSELGTAASTSGRDLGSAVGDEGNSQSVSLDLGRCGRSRWGGLIRRSGRSSTTMQTPGGQASGAPPLVRGRRSRVGVAALGRKPF